MWIYDNNLEFPLNITKPDPEFAKVLITAIGGYSGELGAAMRYFNQSFTMADDYGKKLLTDIATEELAHVEILSNMMMLLTKDLSLEELKKYGLDKNYTEHGHNFFPTDVNGNPYSVTYYAVSGDPITDLTEDLAAEAKAKAVYEHLMDQTSNPEILAPLAFLRQREIIHFQRFGELLNKYLN
ncbi:MAG: manganese catalase family protein [Anaeroplasmataceae bacterium]